jgi:hypothetical protein
LDEIDNADGVPAASLKSKEAGQSTPPRVLIPRLPRTTPIGMERLHDLETITCGELDLLVEGAYRLLRTLRKTYHDYQLTRQGYELVYGLDFSEIFTFLWPERSPQQNRSIILRLLACKNMRFTMPPGSVFELIHSLSRFSTQSAGARNRYVSLINQPFVMSLAEHVRSRAPFGIEADVLYDRFLEEVDDAPYFGGFIGRLRHLHDVENLVDISSFLRSRDAHVEPDRRVLSEAESGLNVYRKPSREKNTFIDAHNYALMYALSESQSRGDPKRIFFFTTSSPIPYSVLRRIKWSRFPEIIKDPSLSETSLVRHPIHAYYLSLLLSKGPGAGNELRFLIDNLSAVLRRVASIPGYKEFLESNRARPSESLRLPHNKEFVHSQLQFRKRYQALFWEAREAIETDLTLERNVRERTNVSQWSIGSGISSDWAPIVDDRKSRGDVGRTSTPQPILFFDRDITLRLFDDVHRMTLAMVKHMRKSLRLLPKALLYEVDLEGIVVSRHPAILSWRRNEEFECDELHASRMVGEREETLAYADVYSNLFAMRWRTSVPFSDFLTACNEFCRQAGRVEPRAVTDGDKAYRGVQLVSEDGQERILRPEEIDIANIQAGDLLEAAMGGPLSLVRIAYPFADLWYDFFPMRGEDQLAGITTHCTLDGAMCDFFRKTSQSKMSTQEGQRIVDSVVQRFSSSAARR